MSSDYLERELIFTLDPHGDHDAWTDVYSNAEFYKWLLSNTREPAPTEEVGGEIAEAAETE